MYFSYLDLLLDLLTGVPPGRGYLGSERVWIALTGLQ